nr:hypothetical protein [Tanacetum cinerariifolium]
LCRLPLLVVVGVGGIVVRIGVGKKRLGLVVDDKFRNLGEWKFVEEVVMGLVE